MGSGTEAQGGDVELLHRLADVAGQAALRGFGCGQRSMTKADGTPVSETDLAVEAALLEVLGRERPGDAVLSEEGGAPPAPGRCARRWIIDPIDGTAEFLRGAKEWGTHVALEIGGELAAGVITRPLRRRRWWAVRGRGAYVGGGADPLADARRVRVSRTAELGRARVGGYAAEGSPAAAALRGAAAGWSGEEPSPMLALAEGRLDVALDEGGHVWDQAPAVLLVREAGGGFCDPYGGGRIDLGWGLYTNGRLGAEAARVLARSGALGPG